MRRVSSILFIIVVWSLTACSSQQKRSMNEMRGDCADYQWDMHNEFTIADGELIAAPVFSGANSAATPVSLNRKLAISLYPTNEVSFLVEPEKRGKKPEEFAGLAKVKVDQDGVYRFSTVVAYWVEIVSADGKRIKSNKFEMQSQCKKIFKSACLICLLSIEIVLMFSLSKSQFICICLLMICALKAPRTSSIDL